MGRRISRIVLGVVSVGIIAAVGYGFAATVKTAAQFYFHVDEVTGKLAEWQKRPLELHGFVQPGSVMKRLDRDHQRLEYKFTEINCGQTIEVAYAGTVPDTFKDGAEVVVKGQLDGTQFNATEILAKCPSKYQMQAGPQTLCSRAKAE